MRYQSVISLFLSILVLIPLAFSTQATPLPAAQGFPATAGDDEEMLPAYLPSLLDAPIPAGSPGAQVHSRDGHNLISSGSHSGWSRTQTVESPAPADLAQAREALESAPLMFIENVGQFNESARFQVRGGYGTLWLAENALWITVVEPGSERAEEWGPEQLPVRASAPEPRKGVNLKLSFVGANPSPRLEPFNQAETSVNYFLGDDPEEWRSNVPVWGGVRYVDLYPGVDLEITGEGGHWSWRLVNHQSETSNLYSDIRLRVEGADNLVLDGDRLRLTTAIGDLSLPLLTVAGAAPASQLTTPAGRLAETTNPEPGTFEVSTSFSAPQPSGAIALLSPVPQDNPADLLYSTFVGGSNSDSGMALALDGAGNALVTGRAAPSGFPTTAGAYDTGHNGDYDIFVFKLAAGGDSLLYSTFVGGSAWDSGQALAPDGAGNVLVTGYTKSSDFPTTAGAYDTGFNGGDYDAFVFKLAAGGDSLLYSTFVGGSDSDRGYALALDGAGNLLVTGYTGSSDFPTTAGAHDTSFNGSYDVFVFKLAAGGGLLYSTFVGGSAPDYGHALALDGAGNVVVTGYAHSSDFPTTAGAHDTSFNGSYDVFVFKLAAGGGLLYSTFVGGSAPDYGHALALDGAGNVVVTGYAHSSDFPTTAGAYDTSFYEGNAFVFKLAAGGDSLLYSTCVGGSVYDWGYALALDGAGNALVTGFTFSSDFPTTTGAHDTGFNGGSDVFVLKLALGGEPGPTYSISGRVTDASGDSLSGVTVSAGAGGEAVTGGDGQYTISGLVAGTYTLTPNAAGYSWTPTSRTVTVPPNATDQDFTGQNVQEPINGQIAFVSDRDGNSEIYLMNADGAGLVNLTNDPASDGRPTWSPDGTQLAFVSNTSGVSAIYVMNADGTGVHRLTNLAAGCGLPVWSPDGSRIAFKSQVGVSDELNIYWVNNDGSGLTRVFSRPGYGGSITWSPDGQRLLFDANIDWEFDLWIVDLDGSGLQTFASSEAWDFGPAWSPSGQYVAFGSDRLGGLVDVYVANQDGSGIRNLTETVNYAFGPAWSPNSQWIAFMSYGEGLHIVGPDGGQLTRLSNLNMLGVGAEWSWSPDTTQVVFAANNGDNHDIYVVSADGTGLTNLTDSPARDSDPVWRPSFSISGRVSDGNSNPIAGVMVSAGLAGSATTDGNGYYTIADLPPGTYTLMPDKIRYTFEPSSRAASVPPDATGRDFTGYNKPPLVFVHGWGGWPPWGSCDRPDPESYFESVDDFLRQAGYYVTYAHLETSPCYTPPLIENVPRLRNEITLAKAATGQDQVILIAHSMGGLVSRAYIEGPDYDGDVAALFTFGSPHLGVPDDLLAFLANGLSLGEYCEEYQPAACDFSVLGMRLFNQDHNMRSGVAYHLVSGDAPNSSRNVFGMITGAILPGADDALVQTSSGIGQSGLIDRLGTDEVHGRGSGPRSYFIRDGGLSRSYTQCLKPVLVDMTSDNCGSVSPLQATAATTPTLTARTPFEYGTLTPGQRVTRLISLEGGPTLFAAQWQAGVFTVTLVDPSDQTIDPAYAASHPTDLTYDADDTAATYYFANTTPGVWQLVLEAASVPTDGSTYITFAAFQSDLTLTAQTDHDWYIPGATATITASLSGSPSSATITATILHADGGADEIVLLPQGPDQYRALCIVPDAEGYAEVRLVASGVSSGGSPFERGSNLAFQISSRSVALTGEYTDTPQPRPPWSTSYQALLVTVGINAAIGGTVGLSADLVDAQGNFVAHSFVVKDILSGTDSLTLRFDGDDIHASQHSGPYTLTGLLLTDQSEAILVLAEAETVYVTAAYDYLSFALATVFLPAVLRH